MKYEIPTGPPTPDEIDQVKKFCVVDYPVEHSYTPPEEMPPLTDFQRQAIEQARAEYAPRSS